MAKSQKHYFVNWIDGMKINKDHFIASENAVINLQQTNNKILINPFNYGILPGDNGETSLDLSFTVDSGNRVSIGLNQCKAITQGGFVVDINKKSTELSGEIGINDFDMQQLESTSGKYFVVLKVNPYKRIPFGDADPTENPPRHPYVMPEYGIFIIPVEQVNQNGMGDFYLVIGKLIMKDSIPVHDKSYIPPCAKISADDRLISAENSLIEFLGKLESDLLVIISKIHSKQQKTPLANSLLFVTERMVTFLSLQITQHRHFLKHLPPVYLFEAAATFARFLRNTVHSLPTESREELLNYFSDWGKLRQGELEKLFLDTANLDYDHHNISSQISKISSFTETLSSLFGTLSTLEFIGKRRDTQIYIKEETNPKKSFFVDY